MCSNRGRFWETFLVFFVASCAGARFLGRARSALLAAGLVLLGACELPTSDLRADEKKPSGQYQGMSYLENGSIRLGVNLDAGGAITYLSRCKASELAPGSDENVVNSYDFGRQIQMSYYSGPVPFTVGDKRPAKHWEHIGWNPIQVGDDFGHHSQVLDRRNDGREIYVKCIPMQWPLDNVPGECTFECWIKLDSNTAHVRSRINNHRSDRAQYQGRGQELPAAYTNGPLYRLMTYTGDKPFTGQPLARIEKQPGEPGPWCQWRATENWSALVRDDGWGLGLFHAGCYGWGGGFAGEPGKGGPRDNPTGYMAPNSIDILDHNIVHEYEYDLILGTLDEIRAWIYAHAPKPGLPDYRFEKDRQGWYYVNARDTGWPIQGELHIALEADDPQLIGPSGFWQASDAPKLYIRAAFATHQKQACIFWQTHADPRCSEERTSKFEIIPDGEYRTYEVNLADSPHYRGVIAGLRFDPVPSGQPGDFVKLKSISFAAPSR
jgi:hypothetical protein